MSSRNISLPSGANHHAPCDDDERQISVGLGLLYTTYVMYERTGVVRCSPTSCHVSMIGGSACLHHTSPYISLPYIHYTMARSSLVLLAAAAVAAAPASAFSNAFLGSRPAAVVRQPASSSALSMRVIDIDSPDAFDKTIESAGSALVVIDYSTTWCGPCKVIAPKFDELSDQYPDSVFLKVRDFPF